MKRLKDNIFAIEVPMWSRQHELYEISEHSVVKYPAPYGWGRIKIFKSKYEIIGTITASEIDFDPTPYVIQDVTDSQTFSSLYRLADNFGEWPYTDNPVEAFRSYFYWYYLPEDCSMNPDDWPIETPHIKGKLLLLKMINLTSENW